MEKSHATSVYRERSWSSAAGSLAAFHWEVTSSPAVSSDLSVCRSKGQLRRPSSVCPTWKKEASRSDDFSNTSSWMKSCSPIIPLRSLTGRHACSRSSAGSSASRPHSLPAGWHGRSGGARQFLCTRLCVCGRVRERVCFLALPALLLLGLAWWDTGSKRAKQMGTQEEPSLGDAQKGDGCQGAADSGGGTLRHCPAERHCSYLAGREMLAREHAKAEWKPLISLCWIRPSHRCLWFLEGAKLLSGSKHFFSQGFKVFKCGEPVCICLSVWLVVLVCLCCSLPKWDLVREMNVN